MLLALFRLFASLPCRPRMLGRLAGRLVYACPGKYRRRLQANAAQAGYPIRPSPGGPRPRPAP